MLLELRALLEESQVSRSVLGRVFLFSFLFAGQSFGQLPELSSPTSLSGAATTARFFAGASIDGGNNYVDSVADSAAVDISAEIHVEASHVGLVGNLYLLIVSGNDTFFRDSSGAFVLWDGSVESLSPATKGAQLQAIETIGVVEGFTFDDVNVTSTTLEFFFAYSQENNLGELYFNGLPLRIAIEGPQSASQTLFFDSISNNIVQGKCIFCHTDSGVASSSALHFEAAAATDFQNSNYNALINYIQSSPNGEQRILAKPQGLDNHGGAVVLPLGSQDFLLWQTFVEASKADIAAAGNDQASSAAELFDKVELLSASSTLRKASLLFSGTLPSADELAAVATGSDSDLKNAIRKTMSGDGFSQFLLESANNQLLTDGLAGSLFDIVDRKYYPNSEIYFSNPTLRDRAKLISSAITEEPLRLIEHVVVNEKPYREILTADYIMMNPYSAEIYNNSLEFANAENYDDWVPAQITDYFRCQNCDRQDSDNIYDIATEYPHAGLLNSPAFLSRYQSTETNRNRARARWAYYYFLGVDIEGISERTTDESALQDENNPTLNNINCIVCHNIMDPVAGAFQNYSDRGFYRNKPGGLDSLPFSYKRDRQSGYQSGDTWFSDMLMPGFGAELAPSSENSLQWLAQEFVEDSRFGMGTVNFWYPAVIGREPYPAPENPEDLYFSSKLAAYNAEQSMMTDTASTFLSGAEGNGVQNLKDLLVSLAMSVQFRALSVSESNQVQEFELADIGFGGLLTPEQLNRKVNNLMGFDWSYGSANALQEVYGLIYGGIDSLGITTRATELTALMSTVVTTFANEASCSIVNNDFAKPQAQRLLFPYVELSSLPANSEAVIRTNIQHLHQRLLGETLALDSLEVSATYELFSLIHGARIANNKAPSVTSASELCIFENVENPITSDPNQTLRSWSAVINYLMRDFRFIHE
ncbi:MAG: DUF1588 domain-containing protein [Pseudohongiellaceae bacterium]